ncbi:uncharacterized protein BO88DRAFT_415427 [Aspergillus vadensis CBS 113365]|uniref:Uncharacterized protein n=1 Tax=Aspergillus vadensis (strain CBS 113365 / IMI 142717 / IBT 24658) TaxID=1448311 RepID=A0A319BAJ1_ASPVC|nr:hypothetical protein BO88DRAFT_415427 [Aspergillus vadensis CBS 113365]PYH68864.1 hypothetical protein BO88DRAFT_415427 [Aspergillus vadensis CBS 113365]
MSVYTYNILNFADTLKRSFEEKLDEQGNVTKRGFKRGDLNVLSTLHQWIQPCPELRGDLYNADLIMCSRKYGPVFIAVGCAAADIMLSPDGQAADWARERVKVVCGLLRNKLRRLFADKKNKPRDGWPQYGAVIYGQEICVFKVDPEGGAQEVEFEGEKVHDILWGRIIRLLDGIVEEFQIPDEMGTE